ncbi:MAG: hypothetical protein IJV77_02000, partial [Clostridia bacterium]|nr:hypothetical protein [Clostridia bacterium]
IDSATVAKWGLTVAVVGGADDGADSKLYDDNKTTDDVATSKVYSNALAVPGTYSKLATVALTGTPEVAYKIDVTVDLTLANWSVGGDDYCPLVFTVDGTEYKIDATNDTVAKLELAIENAIAAKILGATTASSGTGSIDGYTAGAPSIYTTSYAPNTKVPDYADDNTNFLIDWTWASNVDDVKDTALGDAAATGTPATINFALQIDVTQVD